VIALYKKIFQSSISKTFRVIFVLFLLTFLTFSIINFNNVGTEKTTIGTLDVILFIAAFVIGINWSINIYRKLLLQNKKPNPYILIPSLSVSFSLLLMLSLYALGHLIDYLNLMGNGG
jgi:hypothetical protein